MIFKGEVGGIININKQLAVMVEGSYAQVVFPREVLHKLHQAHPGYIYLLAHTHPPGMTGLSLEDKSTLKALALAMYPFPVRMSTITETVTFSGVDIDYKDIVETIYLGVLEVKENWKERCQAAGKTLPRLFSIVKESNSIVPSSGLYSSILANLSYSYEDINEVDEK